MPGLFKKVDCYVVSVPDLEQGISFYSGKLDHRVAWKRETAAGLTMPGSEAEIVLSTELPSHTGLVVDDARRAYLRLLSHGCRSLREPYRIEIGWCAMVIDPFGNELVFLDILPV